MNLARLFGKCFVLAAWIQLGCGISFGASHPLLVVSLDAFRWDYCDRYPNETPNLRRLKREGASAKALISVYPSNTFPNHYSIATGLRPEHHGMINNSFSDPVSGGDFRHSNPAAASDPKWWGGEPIWVTAVKQGQHSACSFWVGSEAKVAGAQPTFWLKFDYSIPFEKRLEQLVNWLTLPEKDRPGVVMFYLEETNSVAHKYGPDSPETAKAIQLLDTRIGTMLDQLERARIVPNLVIVSDHGMTTVKPERCVGLDDVIDLATVKIEFDGPQAGLRPINGNVDQLLEKLQKLPGGAVAYRRGNLPAAWHVGDNPRYPAVWVIPQEGGSISTRKALTDWLSHTKGEHGYDPSLPDMQGTLIVNGPDFVSDGRVVPPVENIELYNVFCAVAHLTPAPNDGDDRLVRELVKQVAP